MFTAQDKTTSNMLLPLDERRAARSERRCQREAAFHAKEAAREFLASLYVRKAVRMEVVLSCGLLLRLPPGIFRLVADFAV